MASSSSAVMFCWWMIYFLLHKLISPFFIHEMYWLSLSEWSCGGWNERFLSCLDISVLSCVLLYTMLLLLIAVPVSSWKNSRVISFCKTKINCPLILVCNILVFQDKNSNPFPKLIFQMAKVVFLICWIWLNQQSFWLPVMISLLMVDRPECCYHLNL